MKLKYLSEYKEMNKTEHEKSEMPKGHPEYDEHEEFKSGRRMYHRDSGMNISHDPKKSSHFYVHGEDESPSEGNEHKSFADAHKDVKKIQKWYEKDFYKARKNKK